MNPSVAYTSFAQVLTPHSPGTPTRVQVRLTGRPSYLGPRTTLGIHPDDTPQSVEKALHALNFFASYEREAVSDSIFPQFMSPRLQRDFEMSVALRGDLKEVVTNPFETLEGVLI